MNRTRIKYGGLFWLASVVLTLTGALLKLKQAPGYELLLRLGGVLLIVASISFLAGIIGKPQKPLSR